MFVLKHIRMKKIISKIRIISQDGGDFAFFFELEDLYSKLSGVKDKYGENMEFIEIGKNIQLDNEILKVKDINLKFENIDANIKHTDKKVNSTPSNLSVEFIITVEFISRG